MTTQFALDLRLARRKSGLMQRDVAQLLSLDPGTLSAIESGKRLPTLREIVTFSVVFGRSFESLFGAIMKLVRKELRGRVKELPKAVRQSAATFNREATLARLTRQLSEETEAYGA